MVRAFAIAATAVLLLGAATRPAGVEYRLGVTPGGLGVEMRLRGDADGETSLVAPTGLASGLAVSGGQARLADATHYAVRHKPGAKLTIRYRLAAGGSGVATLGEAVFAAPEGWDAAPAVVRWQKLPAGWRTAPGLERAGLTVGGVRRSVVLAGADLQTAERPIPGGVLQVASVGSDPNAVVNLADAAAPAVAAERAYWNDETGPFRLASAAVTDQAILERDGGVAIPPAKAPDADLQRVIIEGHILGQTARRLGASPARPADWLSNGLASFLADRIMLRAGLGTIDEAMRRIAQNESASSPTRRGALLALKWDEEIRKKTGGKADLDDVVFQMRDHAAKFPPGQAPDIVTALVSAAWVVAKLDLRPDIARYVDRGGGSGGEAIGLPEEMFDGCLQAAVTVAPGFDSGFNAEASFAVKKVTGVRRRGPAWNSGLRDGMALESWTYKAGDMTRMIELTLRPAGRKAKPRKIAYWPYGDVDTQTRVLRLTPGMSETARAACSRKIGGL